MNIKEVYNQKLPVELIILSCRNICNLNLKHAAFILVHLYIDYTHVLDFIELQLRLLFSCHLSWTYAYVTNIHALTQVQEIKGPQSGYLRKLRSSGVIPRSFGCRCAASRSHSHAP